MRKVMLLAAMLAMVLAAAAPVFAQDVSIDTGDNVEYNAVCQNIIGSIGDITANQGGAAAAGNLSDMDDSAAVATVAQEQGVSVAQVNECLNNATVTATSTATPTATVVAKKKVVHGKTATATVAGVVQYKKTATATATPTATATASATATSAAVLPETGGASLFALGAGALLVGGGLLARRIAR